MKEFLQRTKLMTVLVSIVLIILGILLLVNPTGALLTVCRIAGCILLLSGAVLIAVFLSRKGWESGSVWDVALCVLGVVMLALGLFVIIRPAAVLSFMGLLFAIILFLHGFYDLREMRMLKRMNAGRWRISLICTGVTFLMGILMLFLPVAVGAGGCFPDLQRRGGSVYRVSGHAGVPALGRIYGRKSDRRPCGGD